MNSIENPDVAAEKLLDLHIEAACQQFDATALEQATGRLREKLSPVRGGRRRMLSWPSFVGAATALIVTISALSVFLPGDNGTAFAQAQQWLASFRTLQAETTVVAGDVVSEVIAWLDESGDTRVESPGTATIIKPETGMIYILRPDGQAFAQQYTSDAIVKNSTDFVDKIRTFRGQAERLTESRVIEGISAVGYELQHDESIDVLWVDPVEGRPLLVESQMPGGVTATTILRFDVALPENAFEIPEEVQLLEPFE